MTQPSYYRRWLRDRVLRRFEALQMGRITFIDGGLRKTFGQTTDACDLHATIHVLDSAFYPAIALSGSVGAGVAFAEGLWSSNHLTNVIRILALNRDVINGMEGGLARVSAPFRAVYQWLRRNTRSGSRRNIEAHYDLGNDFFESFLDPTMMYSCGVFETPDASMEEASRAKIARICEKLDLCPDHHVLEIGTGWGGFAIYAARKYGCKFTTTTISKAQRDFAVRRIAEAGLEDRIEVIMEDYRDLKGTYDRVVSIEMIEAVGHKFYDDYFRACSERLRPDGMMLLQAITIQDQFYRRALGEVDFIQRYIFPGSCIPSVEAIAVSITRATDMKIFQMEDIGPHYVRTLATWRKQLEERHEHVLSLGYPEHLLRLWEFYFCYCEGGFAERVLGDVQVLLTKPLARPGAVTPRLTAMSSRSPLIEANAR